MLSWSAKLWRGGPRRTGNSRAAGRDGLPRSAILTPLGRDHSPEDFLPGHADGGEFSVDRDDENRLLLAEVEALPEDYRRVVMLYYYEDLTYRDLAQLLGVSTATINARLTKARALLRERLSSCRR